MIGRMLLIAGLAFAAGCAGPRLESRYGEYEPVEGRIMTRWADEVTPENVHREYPRPQMVREDWLNLNGLWEYAIVPADQGRPEEWQGAILVPFAVESALSGVGKTVDPDSRLWYRRTFRAPRKWKNGEVLLHFGAVDWDTTVWVNGQKVGEHRGGYDPFTFDIGWALTTGDSQEIVVSVWDPTDAHTQPRGKQIRNPHGIWYTPVTGIWQTVWVEPVPVSYVKSLKITPDVDNGRVQIEVAAVSGGDCKFEAIVRGAGTFSKVAGGKTLSVRLPGARLWSPDDPYLYDLVVNVFKDGQRVDSVKSYFGMRKIAVTPDAEGINRLFLNNEPVFQYGPLDQGWWPDGLYTAPTDEALRYDVEVTKQLGMNMLRKHVKVEPARLYYWCDKLGVLVWQDMPSGDRYIRANQPDIVRSEESAAQFELELKRMIDAFYNHPSIVMWVPFNEGWGQYDTARIVEWIQQYDPTRLVNNASGWSDRGVGDVMDIHRYPGPGVPALEEDRAAVLGEFGGLGLPVAGHTWQDEKNWGYRSYENAEELTEAYLNLVARLRSLIGEGLAAAVYTQTTDVEIEVNGLMTYDRDVIKMDPERVAEANRKLYLPPPVVKTIIPTAKTDRNIVWKYTTQSPGEGWNQPGFDDSAWKSGPAGFGTPQTPGAIVGTRWEGSDIWLRRTVQVPAGELHSPQVQVHHDEDVQIYINGVTAVELGGYTGEYVIAGIRDEARKALRPGKNVLAVHCRQTSGGQYVDVGLVDVIEQKK